MIKTIDMQLIRYINLFARISRVSPKHCFTYNNTLIFAVNGLNIQKAIGENSANLKKMGEVVQKKIKVVAIPRGTRDAEKFIATIVSPAQIRTVEIDDGTMIVNAAPQNKAILIGRNKRRFDEMKKIVKEYFGKDLRIV